MTTAALPGAQAAWSAPSGRYEALDGLRGIVALAVVVYHFGDHLGLKLLPYAWVAVDTFFVLSGFVLAHRYAPRIEAGMAFTEFARQRLKRLYPLYAVGLLLGSVDILIEIGIGHVDMSLTQWASTVALGVLLIPHGIAAAIPFGNDAVVGALFPFNEPAWSLFLELAVNVVFVAWLLARRPGWLLPLVVTSAGVYWFSAQLIGTLHGGWSVNDDWVGLPRVMFGFFVGVWIHRIHRQVAPYAGKALWLFLPVLMVTFWRPFRWHEAWSLFVFAPLAVLGNACVKPAAWLAPACRWAGRISYPLYITHFPLFRLLWVEGDIRRLGSAGHLAGACLLAVLLAWVLAIADERLQASWQ